MKADDILSTTFRHPLIARYPTLQSSLLNIRTPYLVSRTFLESIGHRPWPLQVATSPGATPFAIVPAVGRRLTQCLQPSSWTAKMLGSASGMDGCHTLHDTRGATAACTITFPSSSTFPAVIVRISMEVFNPCLGFHCDRQIEDLSNSGMLYPSPSPHTVRHFSSCAGEQRMPFPTAQSLCAISHLLDAFSFTPAIIDIHQPI